MIGNNKDRSDIVIIAISSIVILSSFKDKKGVMEGIADIYYKSLPFVYPLGSFIGKLLEGYR